MKHVHKYGYLGEYHDRVDSGEIIVCEKIKQQISREKEWIKSDCYYFNVEKADYVINVIEAVVKHYKGKWAGQPIVFELWQRYIFSSIFGFMVKESDTRLCRTADVIVARKNGKTFMGAGALIYMLLFDGESAPECYTAATTREQANIAFTDVYKIVQASPELQELLTKTKSAIEGRENDGICKSVSSEANTLDGKNVFFYLLDEKHAWVDGSVEQVMTTGTLSREEPLGLSISSNGVLRGKYFDERYEYAEKLLKNIFESDRESFFIFELDDPEEVHDENMWIKANPNIDVSVDRDTLRNLYNLAFNMPSQKPLILPKNWNIPMTGNDYFFDAEEVRVNEYNEEILNGTSGFLGIDFAVTNDNTVITYVTPNMDKYYTKSWHFIPKGQMQKKTEVEKIPYSKYKDDGVVVEVPGNEINNDDIIEFIIRIQKELDLNILGMGIDPYRLENLKIRFQNTYGKQFVKEFRNSQRWVLTPIMNRFKNKLTHKNLFFNSLLTSLHLINTQVNYHTDDTLSLDKSGNNTNKIDNTMSILYGIAALEDFCKNNDADFNGINMTGSIEKSYGGDIDLGNKTKETQEELDLLEEFNIAI